MTPTQMLDALAACLCDTIEKSTVPNVCFCGVVPGDAPALDYMGTCKGRDGMAWVRAVNLYPASGINVPNESVNNCGSVLGMDLEIGMARTIPLPSGRAGTVKLPTPEAYREASALQNDDALVMLNAVRCCMDRIEDDLTDDFAYVMGTYDPFGPLGGIVGGSWPLAVLLD